VNPWHNNILGGGLQNQVVPYHGWIVKGRTVPIISNFVPDCGA
jgi:hypothetical protein